MTGFDLTIIGLGYVGMPLAKEATAAGLRVAGLDVDPHKIEELKAGRSYIDDLTDGDLDAMLSAGFTPTVDPSVLAGSSTIVICVPTPLDEDRRPDLSAVVNASRTVAGQLRPGTLVVLESTTWPGTTDEVVRPILEESGLRAGVDFHLAFSPERIDPGNPKYGVRNTPKVVGGYTEACRERACAFYSRFIERVVPVSGTREAEMAKLLENTYRHVNIALVNEMAQVSDRLGVDVWEVIEAAGTKPFGFMKFMPGPGIGGHCIPLDPYYLAWKMKTLNYKTRMVELAGEINAEMPQFVAGKVQDALNGVGKAVRGSRVLVLGVAYKKDIDDVRESPALDVMRLLEEKGADVVYHDPYVPVVREDGHEKVGVPLSDEEIQKADVVVIATDHSGVDYERVVRLASLVVDTRNATSKVAGGNVVGLSGERRTAAPAPFAAAGL